MDRCGLEDVSLLLFLAMGPDYTYCSAYESRLF